MRKLLPALLIGLLASIGCGGSSGTSGPVIDQGKLAMEEFAQLLKSLPLDKKQPPTKMTEFNEVEPMAPTAGDMLKKGEIVYIWGQGHKDGSKSVVVYEKKAETEGGWVLLQDGTVKKMSADEFKAAPKAGKK